MCLDLDDKIWVVLLMCPCNGASNKRIIWGICSDGCPFQPFTGWDGLGQTAETDFCPVQPLAGVPELLLPAFAGCASSRGSASPLASLPPPERSPSTLPEMLLSAPFRAISPNPRVQCGSPDPPPRAFPQKRSPTLHTAHPTTPVTERIFSHSTPSL